MRDPNDQMMHPSELGSQPSTSRGNSGYSRRRRTSATSSTNAQTDNVNADVHKLNMSFHRNYKSKQRQIAIVDTVKERNTGLEHSLVRRFPALQQVVGMLQQVDVGNVTVGHSAHHHDNDDASVYEDDGGSMAGPTGSAASNKMSIRAVRGKLAEDAQTQLQVGHSAFKLPGHGNSTLTGSPEKRATEELGDESASPLSLVRGAYLGGRHKGMPEYMHGVLQVDQNTDTTGMLAEHLGGPKHGRHGQSKQL
jgi:hypothetical protein